MIIYSHRGNGFGFAEGSLDAFHTAMKHGYGIECDLRLAPNGEVLIHHDILPAKIHGIPTLSNIVALMKDFPGKPALFELKEHGKELLARVVSEINENNLKNRIIIISFGTVGLSHMARYGIRAGAIDTWPSAMLENARELGLKVTLTGWVEWYERIAFKLVAPFLGIKSQIKKLHDDDYTVILGVAKSEKDIKYFESLGANAVVSDVSRPGTEKLGIVSK